jgi:alginate O-acetyltransferase complex protein AlgI
VNYALFVAYFPQLIAGPIVRYHDIAREIVTRRHSLEDVWLGATRFSIRLAKKVLIADAMGQVAVNVDRLGPDQLTTDTPGSASSAMPTRSTSTSRLTPIWRSAWRG